MLLQVLDDGRITDSHGRTVDFKNTVIIMTSNLGSDIILDGIRDGDISDDAREGVNAILRRSFRPEFLNRLDEIIFFKPLTKENIYSIVDLALASLSSRLEEKRLTVKITDTARDFIIDSAYDPIYGARPLKRFLSSTVETLLARRMIAEDIAPDTELVIDYDTELFVK